MKGKSTKSALLMSFTSLLLCFAMLIGCTFAWFTDSVTSGVNRIIAGNLDIEVSHTNETVTDEIVGINTTLFDKVTLWEPGAVEYENITVKNVGNLAAKVKLNVTDVAKNKMAVGDYDLTQVIKVAVKEGGFTGTVTRDSITADNSLVWTNFQTFVKDFNLAGKSGETVDSKTYGIALYWQPTENDNNWNLNNGKASSDGQPLWINFGLNVVATQNTVEADSFNNQYDAAATFPVLAAVVNETESYSGNFVQNKHVSGGSSESTQVTAKENVTLGSDENAVTLIPAGTTLFKNDGGTDTAITTSNENADGYAGSIVSNIKTTESSAASVTYQISYTYKEGTTETSVSKFSNIVTNVFDISTGLKNVKVSTIHNGGTAAELTKVDTKPETPTDKTYYYDSANGKLYIYSSEYSDFKVTYDYDFVAAVNGQGYATLEGAIAAAQANDTVVLLKDVTLSQDLLINKKIPLNLNGKTVECGTYFLNIAGDVTITGNGTINKEGTDNTTILTYPSISKGKIASFKGAVYVAPSGKLTIKNGTYTTKTSSLFVCNNGILTMEDGLFKCTSNNPYDTKGLIDVRGENGVLDLLGGSVECYENWADYEGMYGVSAWDGGTMNLGSENTVGPTVHSYYAAIATNGSTAPVTINVYSGTYISDCDVTSDPDAESDMNVIQIAANEKDGTVLNIYGGTFTQTAKNAATSHVIEIRWKAEKTINIYGGEFKSVSSVIHQNTELDEANTALSITGGTFSSDPTAYVASGYEATQSGNVWTVGEMPAHIQLTLTGEGKASGEIGGHTFILDFPKGGQIAAGHTSATLTISEVTKANATSAWKVTYSDGTIKYYTFVMDEGYGTEDPSANIYVKDAEKVEPGTGTVMDWCGFGYSCTIDGLEGNYFMIGAIRNR